MVDTVTNTTLASGRNLHVIHLTNTTDGTGETDVVKVDRSALEDPDGRADPRLTLMYAEWAIQGFSHVDLRWVRGGANDVLMQLGTALDGKRYFQDIGGINDPDTLQADGAGDVVLTTFPALQVAPATYDIKLYFKLKQSAL